MMDELHGLSFYLETAPNVVYGRMYEDRLASPNEGSHEIAL